MAAINQGRVVLGSIAGWVVWAGWSVLINFVVLGDRYGSGQQMGWFLKGSRYPVFLGQWLITLFLLAYIAAWLYASVRGTQGPGPGTALRVGLVFGFAAGFPISLSLANWSVMDRVFPLWWMLELWVGAILATLVAGWLYRD